jgi:hypothetical protein
MHLSCLSSAFLAMFLLRIRNFCFSSAKAYIICYSDSAQKQLPRCASCCCGLRVPGFTMMNRTFHLVMRYQIVLPPCILDDDPSQSSFFRKLYTYHMFNFLHDVRQLPIFQMMNGGSSCLMFRKLVKAAHCLFFVSVETVYNCTTKWQQNWRWKTCFSC